MARGEHADEQQSDSQSMPRMSKLKYYSSLGIATIFGTAGAGIAVDRFAEGKPVDATIGLAGVAVAGTFASDTVRDRRRVEEAGGQLEPLSGSDRTSLGLRVLGGSAVVTAAAEYFLIGSQTIGELIGDSIMGASGAGFVGASFLSGERN